MPRRWIRIQLDFGQFSFILLIPIIPLSWVLQFCCQPLEVSFSHIFDIAFLFFGLFLPRLPISWFLFFLSPALLSRLLHLVFLCLFLGMAEVAFRPIASAVYFIYEDLHSAVEFSISVKLFPKETQPPVHPAAFPAVPWPMLPLLSQPGSWRPRFLQLYGAYNCAFKHLFPEGILFHK